MMIHEIALTQGTHDRSPMAHIDIDGKEYMILGCSMGVTVIAGRQWIKSRRTLGKAFYKPEDLLAHYKKHAETLLEYANRVTTWGRTELRLFA